MKPPWIERPDIPYRSIGWRMGWGETHMNDWVRYYTKELGDDAKAAYVRANPTPADWPDWYQAIEQLARTREQDEAWMDAHKAKEKALEEAPPGELKRKSIWRRLWHR